MKLTKGLNPVARAVGVISAVAIVTGGVTFAALSSSVTLSNTTLRTADANLQIYNFQSSAFSSSAPGFNLNSLIPTEYSEEQEFYLKNNGETALNVTASVLADETMTHTGLEDKTKLTLRFTGEACGETKEATLAKLMEQEVALPCNPLEAGATGNSSVPNAAGNYSVAFKLANGVDAVITGLDLQFTGTVTTTPVQNESTGDL